MMVRFVVQANMLASMEFEFKCFFYDLNVEIVEFRMFFYKHDISLNGNLHILVRQKNCQKLSKQTGQHVGLIFSLSFILYPFDINFDI